MYYIEFPDSTKKEFKRKIDIKNFLESEKKKFLSYWDLSNNKIEINDRVCGNEIYKIVSKNYDLALCHISEAMNHPNDSDGILENFSIELENLGIASTISNLYKKRKLLYSEGSFSQKLKDLKDKNMQILPIYMIGVITNYIQNEPKEKIVNEILELAYKKVEEYKELREIENFRKNPYRVLVIEGGGILGYYEASLLHKIDASLNISNLADTDIGKKFNMICGTSTGAILASGLAKGIPLSQIKQLYRENAKKIFPNPTPEGKISLYKWAFKHRNKPSSSAEVLSELLEEQFGDTTLSEIWSKREIALCIPSTYIGSHKPIVFKTPHKKEDISEGTINVKLKDACLASASAPIYFPFAEIENKQYVDGGLWANNPILIGLTEALSITNKNQPIEIYLLSTPIISSADPEFANHKKQGLVHWKAGINIINISIFTQSRGSIKIAKSLEESFRKVGREISIISFPTGKNPSEKQLQNLGLDKNSELTFEIMDALIEDIDFETDISNEIKELFKLPSLVDNT